MADVKDLSAYKGVWVFAEQREGKIMPVVIELLGEGRKLADAVGCELCAVLLGDKVEGLTDDCSPMAQTRYIWQMIRS